MTNLATLSNMKERADDHLYARLFTLQIKRRDYEDIDDNNSITPEQGKLVTQQIDREIEMIRHLIEKNK